MNTFGGYTFTCPICNQRDCAWWRLACDEEGKPLRSELFCTKTGQTLTNKNILQALLEEWGDSLPDSIRITLGEKPPDRQQAAAGREGYDSRTMTWPERIDIALSIAAHVPWRWFAIGAICGMVVSAIVVGIAVVVVGLEQDR